MATRKQRKRSQKERRHEYETVWVDAEGNELEEPPDDLVEPAPRQKRANGQKPQQKRPQRSSRAAPLPPSWRRAAKRSLLLGGVIFVLFVMLSSKDGTNAYISAFVLALGYTALFVPFTYYVDRFSYRRWEQKAAEQPRKR